MTTTATEVDLRDMPAPNRPERATSCYRMLASPVTTERAIQDGMLTVGRGSRRSRVMSRSAPSGSGGRQGDGRLGALDGGRLRGVATDRGRPVPAGMNTGGHPLP
jgi:hypothetical protein